MAKDPVIYQDKQLWTLHNIKVLTKLSVPPPQANIAVILRNMYSYSMTIMFIMVYYRVLNALTKCHLKYFQIKTRPVSKT